MPHSRVCYAVAPAFGGTAINDMSADTAREVKFVTKRALLTCAMP
jgi:hypothetical protein